MKLHEDNHHRFVAVAKRRGFLWAKKIDEISSSNYMCISDFLRKMFSIYGRDIKIEIYSVKI